MMKPFNKRKDLKNKCSKCRNGTTGKVGDKTIYYSINKSYYDYKTAFSNPTVRNEIKNSMLVSL